MEKLLLRVDEAAALAAVSRTTAYARCASGAWPGVRVGTALRVPLAGLRAWVAGQQGRGRRAAEDHDRSTDAHR